MVGLLVDSGILELTGGSVYRFDGRILAESRSDMSVYLQSKDPAKTKIVATMCLKLIEKMPDDNLKGFAKTAAMESNKVEDSTK